MCLSWSTISRDLPYELALCLRKYVDTSKSHPYVVLVLPVTTKLEAADCAEQRALWSHGLARLGSSSESQLPSNTSKHQQAPANTDCLLCSSSALPLLCQRTVDWTSNGNEHGFHHHTRSTRWVCRAAHLVFYSNFFFFFWAALPRWSWRWVDHVLVRVPSQFSNAGMFSLDTHAYTDSSHSLAGDVPVVFSREPNETAVGKLAVKVSC